MSKTTWNCTQCHHLQDDAQVCEVCKSPNPYFVPHSKQETIVPNTPSRQPLQEKIFTDGWNDNHELPENWESSID